MVREAGAALGLENPYFRPHEGVAGARSVIGDREVLNFASYNYLGLNGDARVTAAAQGGDRPARRLGLGLAPGLRRAARAWRAGGGAGGAYGAEACLAFVSGPCDQRHRASAS